MPFHELQHKPWNRKTQTTQIRKNSWKCAAGDIARRRLYTTQQVGRLARVGASCWPNIPNISVEHVGMAPIHGWTCSACWDRAAWPTCLTVYGGFRNYLPNSFSFSNGTVSSVGKLYKLSNSLSTFSGTFSITVEHSTVLCSFQQSNEQLKQC